MTAAVETAGPWTADLWTAEDEACLLDLLAIDTTTPMEHGSRGRIAEAQRRLIDHALTIGFAAVHWRAPDASCLDRPDVPVTVRERARALGADFLEAQPNLVLHLGAERPPDRRLVFNAHMDTVGGGGPARATADRLQGRGVIDAKGLAVAVLAGVRAALARDPSLMDTLTVQIQAPAGEEGGAMGVYGTRVLTEAGVWGRLNVICEPTDGGYFDRTTTSATARIRVEGQGSTDDDPCRGENATLLLAALADRLAHRLAPRVLDRGGKICLAGLQTGAAHNRVYGSGHLLINFAYTDPPMAKAIEAMAEAAFTEARDRFAADYRDLAVTRAAALAADRICRMDWLKRGLPVLSNRDPTCEALLAAIGLDRIAEGDARLPFTCDAMWLARPEAYTIVFGPGDLGRNRAHAEGEFIDRRDLYGYVDRIARLCLAMARHLRDETPRTGEDGRTIS
ncbi:M20/M25/M40 family metallo-hydrolase [Roseospira visakhapatnamensis]|uniref:Acetylornithine deacetylase n=1 Tax=Roseospira visakhapatnamensis TaxID=390880 RepID=A0A7W6RA57_9PROT|nr:M20/M25/M40 family metallo-hydrolase [Roseospira visakhapatnamensis]MBB4264582.1 acetylornithine deacetylase [Roseospira visakhapatnamensis]